MKILIAILFTLLLTACSSEPTTKFDYNEKTNFSLLKSYQFVAQITPDLDANPVMVFMKGTKLMPQCGFSAAVVGVLNHMGIDFNSVNVFIWES